MISGSSVHQRAFLQSTWDYPCAQGAGTAYGDLGMLTAVISLESTQVNLTGKLPRPRAPLVKGL